MLSKELNLPWNHFYVTRIEKHRCHSKKINKSPNIPIVGCHLLKISRTGYLQGVEAVARKRKLFKQTLRKTSRGSHEQTRSCPSSPVRAFLRRYSEWVCCPWARLTRSNSSHAPQASSSSCPLLQFLTPPGQAGPIWGTAWTVSQQASPHCAFFISPTLVQAHTGPSLE